MRITHLMRCLSNCRHNRKTKQFSTADSVLAVPPLVPRLPTSQRVGGMNTFSETGNDFVGRLLHEGGVSRMTFLGFSQNETVVRIWFEQNGRCNKLRTSLHCSSLFMDKQSIRDLFLKFAQGIYADQSQQRHRRMWRCRSSCPLLLARPSPPRQPRSQPPPPPRRSLA